MNPRLRLALALLLPLLLLAAMAWQHQWRRDHGREVVLPIQGFDPRDLLAGHYLRYRIDYGIATCTDAPNVAHASVCLEPAPRFATTARVPGCTLFIQGQCRNRRFEAGVERYYIPADAGPALENQLREHRAAIRLSVTADGHASIRALLIDAQEWNPD